MVLASTVYPIQMIAAGITQLTFGLEGWRHCFSYINNFSNLMLILSLIIGLWSLKYERLALYWVIPIALAVIVSMTYLFIDV